jgi:hypothetical protein
MPGFPGGIIKRSFLVPLFRRHTPPFREARWQKKAA